MSELASCATEFRPVTLDDSFERGSAWATGPDSAQEISDGIADTTEQLAAVPPQTAQDSRTDDNSQLLATHMLESGTGAISDLII